jgi:sec-independent protein translocase protein TatA
MTEHPTAKKGNMTSPVVLIGNLGPTEIILILLVIVLLFGAKKLPELARGSGRALRIFKAETKGLRDDDDDREPRHEQAERSDVRPAPRVLPGTVEDRDQGTPRATEQQTER